MDELKERLGVVLSVAKGQLNLGTERLNYEFVSLNFRKALELIAFASLAAHRQQYAEIHKGFHKHWNAKGLLECIEKVHPQFYPRPVSLIRVQDDGSKLIGPKTDGFLTREQFVTLYDLTSDVVHTWNPFTQRPRKIDFGVHITEWLDRFYHLLDLHWIQFVGRPDVWLVQMHGQDGKAHVLSASPTEMLTT